MKIWVDADACPVVIRDVLYRASQRTGVEVTLVANQFIRTPASPKVNMLQVQQGFDVADNEIVKRCQAGDLVITSDIPLADEVITKGAQALNSRGEMYSKENIKARLNMRDFMDTMRSSGVQMGGPPPLSQADRQQFANHLDKWLVHWQRSVKATKPE
ncbi:YaiI/YqxD family protein [Vibrio scophthalmi]|uniref:YaiI/YqxD family protein n=1 Tax=Vibrio scophthalmi TaxID=45658 RepID=UPI002FF1B1AC